MFNRNTSIKNRLREAVVIVITFLISITAIHAQTYVSAPLSSSTLPPGQYYNNTTISLSPGFAAGGSTGNYRFYINRDCSVLGTTPSSTQNYAMTTVPHIAGYVPGTAGYTSCDIMQSIQYIDGLGRPLQTVQVKGSAMNNDVVQPIAYDAFGREAFKYLPYTTNSNTPGAYQPAAITSQGSFYSSPPSGVGAINTPQAGTAFEPSPLNRVLEQGAPGDAWQLTGTSVATGTSGHTIRMQYTANTGSSTDTTLGKPAIAYKISSINSDQSRTLANNGNFALDLLDVTVTQDENHTTSRGGTMETYTDKEGRVVLKRTFTNTGGVSQFYSTYYVYDNLGNLCFVLPPGALPDNGLTSSANQTTLDNLCYQYRYDERNRLFQKKLPGKAWEYTVYNQIDQPVLSQDGNQRANNQWTVAKYDGQGRVIMTGLWNAGSAIAQSTLQASIYTAAQWDVVDYSNNTTANPYGYVISSYPALSSVLSVNYYDGYTNIPNIPANAAVVPTGASTRNKGQLTANLTNVLGTTTMLFTVMYYDELGRAIQTYAQHYYNGTASVNNYDIVTNSYNFNNLVTATNRQHFNSTSIGAAIVTVANTYNYDHVNRKTQTFETINNGPTVMLSQADFNEIGQVMAKHLHSTTGGAPFFQDIAYTYNERGWMLSNNANLFSEQLQYNSGTSKQYNGNIMYQNWQSATTPSTNTYTYSYDRLNRLLTANSIDNNNEAITYDLMGNISALNRTAGGATTYIDQLTYAYTGNQLQTLVDNSGSNTGAKAGTSTYTYDANGNAITDQSRYTGNIAISYNLLNLPQAVTGAKTITYIYAANGQKLRRVSAGTGNTDYISGIQYDGGNLSFIQTEEGKALYNGGSYNYEYYLSDHLGNTRITFDSSTGSARQVQQDDYYAFGMEISRGTVTSPKNEYLYNKKELQEELGQLDYGARFYDPVIGRFNTVDPLAEKDRRWSSYSYGHNNPISHIDVDGMFDWVKDQDGDIKWDKNAKSQATTKEGETYLGKDLKFTFNSYINNTFDGPNPPWGATGDKLTSTINLTSQQDADGNLTSVSVKSSYDVAATGGLSMFKGRNFFPGLGDDQNKGINISNATGFNATFEQHASVPGLEAAGLALLGYSAVNVAQKLTLGLSGNNLSVSAATDVFPSATLSVNGNQLFQYNQPSFKATHGNSLIDFGSSTRSPSIIHRPAPNFYNRYDSN